MTSIRACKELWTEMARIAREENEAVEKYGVPSPWTSYNHQCPCIDVEFFCRLIAEMAEEAIKRLEKD